MAALKGRRRAAAYAVFGLAVSGACVALCRRTAPRPPAGGDPGVFDLYLVGESTMHGGPFDTDSGYSPDQLISKMFDGRIGGRRIVPHVIAQGGESIYPQAFALEQALRGRDPRRPGAMLLYSGHNDAMYRSHDALLEAVKEDFIFRVPILSRLWFRGEKDGAVPRVRTLRGYEYHLGRIVAASRKAGLTPILTTVVGNVSDVDPGLYATPDLPSAPDIVRLLEMGEKLETEGRFQRALDYYAGVGLRFPGLARYLHYPMARTREAAGDYAQARSGYWDAIDQEPREPDPTMGQMAFLRARRPQNEAVRRVARSTGALLVDAVAEFDRRSPHGITGSELIIDGQHPTMEGHRILAEAYALALSKAFGEPLRRRFSSEEEALRALGYGPQDVAKADEKSAVWMLSVSSMHLYPKSRLVLARRRFEEALAVDPGSPSILLGLAFVEAGLHGYFQDAEDLKWFDSKGLFYSDKLAIPAAELPALLRELRVYGVSPGLLERVEDAYRRRPPQARPVVSR